MNSAISSLHVPAGGQRWGKDGGVVAPAGGSPQALARQPAAAAPLRGEAASGWRYSVQLNDQLTSAQRAQGFVDDMLQQLEGFKDNLSRQLTQRQIDKDGLRAQRGQLQQAWQKRERASGGSLDAQLRFHLAADARQRFGVRGLDLESLTREPAETLVLQTGDRGSAPSAVLVGDGAGEEEILRRLNRALAPSGVRCELDRYGQLGFSVAERDWAALQGNLAIRGDGVRFPSGVPQPARPEAEPPALDAERWQVEDHAQVRQALQGVVRTIAQLQQSRQAIASAIEDARRAIEKLSRQDETSWAGDFVTEFNARLNQRASYQQLQEILPALLGVSRYQVIALLSLR
nr:hypothetical protein [Chromobacterium sp. ASV5]